MGPIERADLCDERWKVCACSLPRSQFWNASSSATSVNNSQSRISVRNLVFTINDALVLFAAPAGFVAALKQAVRADAVFKLACWPGVTTLRALHEFGFTVFGQ